MNTSEFNQIAQLIDSCTNLDDLAAIEKWLNRQNVVLSQWERNKAIMEAAKRAGIDISKL